MEEIWKPVVGYESLYEVSNFGNVKRVDKNRLLTGTIQRCGYKQVLLSKNGVKTQKSVHRLVAVAFIPNPLNLPQVNHKDENKTNNFVWINPDGSVDPERSNLEWCTAEYNSNYGTRNVKVSNAKKTSHPKAKKVMGINIETDAKIYFCSCAQANISFVGKDTGLVKMALNPKYQNKTAYGYKWEYV